MPSSVIQSYNYNPEMRSLAITLTTGRRYRYDNVPPLLAEGLDRATSKGGFFNRRFRDRYSYVRLCGSV